MGSFGKLEEFDPEQGHDWGQYIERLEHYFVANDTDNAGKQKVILLSACGSKTYKLMCDLFPPKKPGDKTFLQLKQALQDHIHPKHSEIVQRYQKKNHLHFGQEHESVSNFVSQLRSLSTDRNFANTLERMLRDRLVCRINNYRIQRRLLAEKDLTFVKALDIATALELAEKSAADLHDSTSKGTRNVSGTSEGDMNFI